MTLDGYLKVKNGQDLIDAGVCPKDISTHVALIAMKRLKAIRDTILAGIDDDMLGRWVPLAKAGYQKVPKEISDADEIMKYAKPCMRVRGKKTYEEMDLKDVEGTLKVIQNDSRYTLGVEWDVAKERMNALKGDCKPGHGWYVTPDVVDLLIPEGKIPTGFSLEDRVVADPQFGHKVRFKNDYKGSGSVRGSSSVQVNLKSGSVGQLVVNDTKNSSVAVKVKIDDKEYNVVMSIEDAFKNLESSSLGQLEPLDKQEEVRKQTLKEFLPRTMLEPQRTERIVIGLLMGKDLLLYGPPGGGKSEAARDIVSIAQQKELIFHVEGCQVQCNPFSLFDEDFAEIVPPCAECMIRHDPEFKVTGRFKLPKPKDVKVTVAKFTEGKGIEYVEGTTALSRMHTAGYKIPDMTADGRISKSQNDFDPEGFSPGMLPRTNNGLLHLDEGDELRPQAIADFLEALNNQRIKPDQLRFSYPANNLVVITTNDHTAFKPKLTDRMLVLAVRYTDDADVAHEITRRAFHREIKDVHEYPIDDTQQEQGIELRDVPVPVTLERAVSALYIKFRKEYNGAGKSEISGSERSKNDALLAARAKLVMDQLFYGNAPQIATEKYVLAGVFYALCSRVREQNEQEDKKGKDAVIAWTTKQYLGDEKEKLEGLLKKEVNTWWCRAYQEMAIASTQIPELEGNFQRELKTYKEDPEQAALAYKKVKYALENPKSTAAQKSRIEYPFIDYLFQEQPGFNRLNERQLIELMNYFVKSSEGTVCQVK